MAVQTGEASIGKLIDLGNQNQLLKTDDVQLLKDIDMQVPLDDLQVQKLKDTVMANVDQYIVLFVKVFNNIHHPSVVPFFLSYLSPLTEMVSFNEAFANIGQAAEGLNPVEPFMGMLEAEYKAKSWPMLAAILSMSSIEAQEGPINVLTDNCIEYLAARSTPERPEADKPAIAARTLTFLLRNVGVRPLFAQKNGIPRLLALIRDNIERGQLIYEVGFCLWMLSYDDQALIMMHKHKGIPLLHDIMKHAKGEKCVRMAVYTFNNFVRLQQRQPGFRTEETRSIVDDSAPSVDGDNQRLNIFSDMLSINVLRTLHVMARKPTNDADLPPEIAHLIKVLEQNIEDTTSFADYAQELGSGRLDKSNPAHTSEKFWKENIHKFEADNCKALRELGAILQNSNDPTVLACACHDFGEFVKYNPQGRRILNTLRVKDRILELIGKEGENPAFAEVRTEALLCTQKIMVQKWDMLA